MQVFNFGHSPAYLSTFGYAKRKYRSAPQMINNNIHHAKYIVYMPNLESDDCLVEILSVKLVVWIIFQCPCSRLLSISYYASTIKKFSLTRNSGRCKVAILQELLETKFQNSRCSKYNGLSWGPVFLCGLILTQSCLASSTLRDSCQWPDASQANPTKKGPIYSSEMCSGHVMTTFPPKKSLHHTIMFTLVKSDQHHKDS